jgi:hypothetical protein
MAYENTHLWAADGVMGRIKNSVLKEHLTANLEDYYFGAVFPDTLSYSKDKKMIEISDFLHGETGIPSNRVVFDMLDRAKDNQDGKNLAFICGFLTHCAMDIVLHPMVVYFSGYKPGNNPRQALESAYLHWHYETCIDTQFNHTFYVDNVIKPAAVQNAAVASVLNISAQIILDSLERQISFFKQTRRRLIFMAYRILYKTGIAEKKYLGGFYANLDIDQKRLPQNLRYKDIISGEKKEITLDGLIDQGIEMGVKMIESAYDYYCGKVSRQVCERTVVGNSLDTGRIGKTKADVKFSVAL